MSPGTWASAASGCQTMGWGQFLAGGESYLSSNGEEGFGACHQLYCLQSCNYSQSRVSGRMRVPFDGPPTRITPFVTTMVMLDNVQSRSAIARC